MTKIKNQFFNKPSVQTGYITHKKSVTIPGQDFTPQEILRQFTQGRHLPDNVFTDVPVDSFKKMSIQDKMDYLRSLTRTNAEQRTQITNKLKSLHSEFTIKQQKEAEQKLRDKIKKEIRENDDDKNKK